MDDFVGVLCRARMSEREAIQLIVEMYRPLMLKYANLNTGFDDDLYQEFVCCVISCIFKSPIVAGVKAKFQSAILTIMQWGIARNADTRFNI